MRHAELSVRKHAEPDTNPPQNEVASTVVYSRVFAGRTDQVHIVRASLGQALAGCPMADDAVLAASELAANAVLHSRSREHGGRFTVRAETYAGDYLWLEVEDGGGPWAEPLPSETRGRGLAIVAAVSSEWGVEGDALARVVWARFDWPSR
jgi:serine/threonine-protein kinase RsbW